MPNKIPKIKTSSNPKIIEKVNEQKDELLHRIIPELKPDEFVAKENETLQSKTFQDKIKQKFKKNKSNT